MMRVKYLNWIIGGAILGILALGWVATRSGSLPDGGASLSRVEPKPAPNFELLDYSGQTVRFADLTGTPLVINSWASWCPPCRQELLEFRDVQKELGDQFKLVAINRAEPKDVAKQYTDELGISQDLLFLLDPDDSFYRQLGGIGMPETIFVNRAGQTVFHKRGPMDAEELKQRLEPLLEQ